MSQRRQSPNREARIPISMVLSQRIQWIVMLALVMLMGPIHPPTRNDDLDIGWFRRILGTVSLVIPVLCFPPRALWWLGE